MTRLAHVLTLGEYIRVEARVRIQGRAFRDHGHYIVLRLATSSNDWRIQAKVGLVEKYYRRLLARRLSCYGAAIW